MLPGSCLCVRLINFNVEFSCGKNITIATCLRSLFFTLKYARCVRSASIFHLLCFVGFSINFCRLFPRHCTCATHSLMCLLVLNFISFFISLNLLFRIVRIPLYLLELMIIIVEHSWLFSNIVATLLLFC